MYLKNNNNNKEKYGKFKVLDRYRNKFIKLKEGKRCFLVVGWNC